MSLYVISCCILQYITLQAVLLTATIQTFDGEILGLPLHRSVFCTRHICGQTVAAAGAQIVLHVHGVNPQKKNDHVRLVAPWF